MAQHLDQVSLSNIFSFCMQHEVFLFHSLVCKQWNDIIYSNIEFYNYYKIVTADGYTKLKNPTARIDKVFNYFEFIRHSYHDDCLIFDDFKHRIYSNPQQRDDEQHLIIIGKNGHHYSFYGDASGKGAAGIGGLEFIIKFNTLNGRIASDSELSSATLIENAYRFCKGYYDADDDYSCTSNEYHGQLKNFYNSLGLKITFVAFLAIIECYLKGTVYEGNNIGYGIFSRGAHPIFLMACLEYVNFFDAKKGFDIGNDEKRQKCATAFRSFYDFPSNIEIYNHSPNRFNYFKKLVDLGFTWTKDEFEILFNKFKGGYGSERYLAHYARKRDLKLAPYISQEDLVTLTNIGSEILNRLLEENAQFPKVITNELTYGANIREEILKYNPETVFPFCLNNLNDRIKGRICVLVTDPNFGRTISDSRFSVHVLPKRITLTSKARNKFEVFLPTIKDFDYYILYTRGENKNFKALVTLLFEVLVPRPLILCLEGQNTIDILTQTIKGIEDQVICCTSFYSLSRALNICHNYIRQK